MFSDPVKNIEQCGIQAGMEIADLGSGSGAYAIATAKALVSTGKVYAIDINKDLLNKVKNDGVKQGLYNIEVIWGDIDKPNGSKLRDFSVDMALVCNILFQVENKDVLVKEVRRILKPGGRVLVVDWTDSFGGLGPKPGAIIKMQDAVDMFEKNGFHLDREIGAGSHHYGLILKKL
jgi:ubiquinone/menaquinone biosynthesis C-methylase UbiE